MGSPLDDPVIRARTVRSLLVAAPILFVFIVAITLLQGGGLGISALIGESRWPGASARRWPSMASARPRAMR